MKTLTNELSWHNLKALEYLLDHELDDFNENPSPNHVYFYAYSAYYGEKNAINELKKAINFRTKIEEIE